MKTAGLDFLYFLARLHALEVEKRTAAFYLIGERRLDMRPIDEATSRHFLDGMRLSQKLEHLFVAARNDGRELIQQGKEVGATFNDALMMEGHIEIRILIADLSEAGLEVFEITPNVSVVGAKSGQVDVGEKEHAVGDPKPAVASGMSWKVHRLGLDLAEIEDGAVLKSDSIGAWCEMEFLDNDFFELAPSFTLEAIDLHQPVD